MNEELDKDISELEAQLFGATDEGTKDDGVTTETPDSGESKETGDPQGEVKTVAEQEDLKPEVKPQEETEVEKDERDWKFEYTKVRADSDRFKYEARQTIKSLRAKVEDLEVKLMATKKDEDVFKDTFTEEDVSKLGDDAITVIKKASKTASDAVRVEMESKLDAERTRRLNAEKVATETKTVAEQTNFTKRLAKAVPNYDTIDHDLRFEKYLYEADPINGGRRIGWFREANNRRDVATIAGYMKDFEKIFMAPKVDKLAPLATPESTAAAVNTQVDNSTKDPEMWGVSEMEAFYADATRGKYKLKPSLLTKHQTLWDDRVEQGLIDYMR